MHYLITLLAVIFVSSSCNKLSNNTFYKNLRPSNLPDQTFVINTSADTVITTKAGIIITVAANSIAASQATVTLQIKEALNIHDMILAGLFTESKEGILSSGGMIKITTKESSTIKKEIAIDIPTQFTDGKMKLYKGEEDDDKIVWKDPKAVAVNNTTTLTGGELFIQNCSSCHSVSKELTASALANVTKRRSKEWLYGFTRNSDSVLHTGDGYACCIYKKYNRTQMNKFPHLNDKDLNALYAYIDKVTDSLGIRYDPTEVSDCDSCDDMGQYVERLEKQRDSLVSNNGQMVEETVMQPDGTPAGSLDTTGEPVKVSAPIYNAEYYRFTISALGWYNIDVLLQDKKGVEMSELRVRVNLPVEVKLNVSLIIPSTRTFSDGGFLEGGSDFGFYNQNGEIPLPQKTVAHVLAMGEGNGKMYLGTQSFITSLKQVVVVKMREVNRETLLQTIESLQLDSVSVTVEKTKNFSSIKKIDEELKRLDQKCSCAARPPVSDADTLRMP